MDEVKADLATLEKQLKDDEAFRKRKTFWNVSIPLILVGGLLLVK
jgi:hypothetical protein